jgi:hypothetical protein
VAQPGAFCVGVDGEVVRAKDEVNRLPRLFHSAEAQQPAIAYSTFVLRVLFCTFSDLRTRSNSKHPFAFTGEKVRNARLLFLGSFSPLVPNALSGFIFVALVVLSRI